MHKILKSLIQLIVLLVVILVWNSALFGQCNADAGLDAVICNSQSAGIGGSPSGTGSGAITYQWSPGSGLSCTNCPNPTATPSQTTNYTLTIMDTSGCSATDNVVVAVNTAALNEVSDFINCTGSNFLAFVFDNSSVSGATITNYQISWGDGSPDYNSAAAPSNLSHNYANIGIFTLTYTITLSNGCSTSTSYTVYNITNPAIGAANPGNTSGCGPISFCFPITNYQMNHPSTNYFIDFGDGSAGISFAHPPPDTICHTYTAVSCGMMLPQNGYIFSILAGNACDTSIATVAPIKIFSPPQASFSANPNPGCINQPVTFTNTSIEGYNAQCQMTTFYTWDFGDGTQITIPNNQNVTHNYNFPGTYTVTLLAFNNTCDSSSISLNVCIDDLPNASFNIPQGTGCIPFSVQTTNTSNILNVCVPGAMQWSVVFNSSVCSPSSGSWNYAPGSSASSFNPEFIFNDPGQYTIQLQYTNNCSTAIATENIIVKTKPEVSIQAKTDYCETAVISPVANVNACYGNITAYNWSFPGGTPPTSNMLNPGNINYAAPGTYTVTFSVTNECGTSTATTNFTVFPPPTFPFPSSNSPLCVGQTIQLTSNNIAGGSYSWSGPNGWSSTIQNPSIPNATTSMSGSYILTLSVNGCPRMDTVDVVVDPLPIVSITPAATTLCVGESVMLTASGAGAYTWTPSASLSSNTGDTVFAMPTSNTTYSVTGTDVNGCMNTASVNITVIPLPILSITPNNPAICIGQSVTLQVSGASSYIWSPAAGLNQTTGSSVIASPQVTTTYSVTGTDPNGCSNAINVTVTVNPLPALGLQIIDNTICDGESTQITATGAVNYSWSPSGSLSSSTGSPVTASPSTTTTYTVTGTNGIGCTDDTTFTIFVDALPTINVGGSFSLCIDEPVVTLTASPTGGTWSGTGIINPASGTFDPMSAGAGTTTVTYTYVDPFTNCENSADQLITVNPLPTANAGPDSTLCNQPVPIQLSGAPLGGIWSGNGVTTNGIFTPGGLGSFNLTYTFQDANGCTNIDDMTITVINAANVNAGPDVDVCIQSPSFSLTATPIGGTWTGSNVTPTGTFSPVASGQFELIYFLGSGSCLTSDTVIVTVNDLPIVDAGPNLTYCIDETPPNLTGSPTGGTWSGIGIVNATTGAYDPVLAGPGNWNVTYTFTDNATGCTNSDNRTITVHPLPVVNAGPDSIVCNQPIGVQLTGSPIGGTWSGSGISLSGLFTPNGLGTFTEIYTYQDGNGCISMDTAIITVVDPAVISAGNDTAVCVATPSFTLMGIPTGGTWTGANVTPTGIFSPVSPGTFQLIYQIGTGSCLKKDTVDVTVYDLPLVDAGSDLDFCIDDAPFSLTGIPSGGTWSGAGVTSGSFDPSLAGAGSWIITYMYTDNITGCSNSDTRTITVNPLPVVNAGPDSTVCNQPFGIQLTGNPPGGTWSGLGITPGGLYTPNGLGTFTMNYTFQDANGCINSDFMIISVIDPAVINAGNDTGICILSPSISMIGTPPGGTWTGTNVTSVGIFSPVSSGIFELIYQVGSGSCFITDTVEVTVYDLPMVDAGIDLEVCIDEPPPDLTGLPSGGTWFGTGIIDSIAGTFDPALAGAGSFVISYSFTDSITGCVNSDTRTVTVYPLPVVDAGPDTIVCNQPVMVQLTGLPAGGQWSGAGITFNGIFTPSSVGTFTMTYTYSDQNLCTNNDSMSVTVISPQLADAGTEDTLCINDGLLLLSGFNPPGGNWTGPGIVNPTTGTFDPLVAGSGSHLLTYSYGAGTCLNSDTKTVLVNPLPTINAGNDLNACVNNSPQILQGFSPPGGFWTGTGVIDSSGIFDPILTGVGQFVLTYTFVEPSTGCINSDSLNMTVNPLPIVSAGNDTTFCNSSIPGILTGYSPPGGVWTGIGVSSGGVFIPNTAGLGTHILTYTFTDANGCLDSAQISVSVINPTQAIAGPDVFECFDVGLDTLIGFSPLGGFWTGPGIVNPGGGVLQTQLAGVGLHDLVYSFGTGTCLTTDTIQYEVYPLPQPDFSSSSICLGLTTQFTDLSTANASSLTSWQWDYDDGSTASGSNPQHTYTSPGNYMVSLSVVNSNQCTEDTTKVVTVYPLPTVSFSFDDTVCANVTFQLIVDTPDAVTYDWDFGDGTTFQGLNPTYTFTTPGIYEIQLIATTAFGCVDSSSQIITIADPPNADFSLDPDSGCAPLAVDFFPDPPGMFATAYTYFWDFGQGDSSFQLVPPTIIFPSGSYGDTMYTVEFRVYSFFCNTIDVHSEEVLVHPFPNADFFPDQLSGCHPLTVEFFNTSLGSPTSFFWDFGDGTTMTTMNLNAVQHTFTNTGTTDIIFTVQLTAFNPCGFNVEEIQITVHPNSVIASLASAQPNGCRNDVITFQNNSVGGQYIYYDFGDGSGLVQNSAPTITHTYSQSGNYTVYQFVYSADSCSFAQDSLDVIIFDDPISAFALLPDTYGCEGYAVIDFINESIDAVTYQWDFGNGDSSTAENPTGITFGAAGEYEITLIAFSAEGCPDTFSRIFTVYPFPEIQSISIFPDSGCQPLSVLFSDSTIHGDLRVWDFGDGSNPVSTNSNLVAHTYTDTGTYQVTLMAYSFGKCGDTLTAQQEIRVFIKPTAEFTFETNDIAEPFGGTAIFTNLSENADSFLWNFGDNEISTERDPIHEYASQGAFKVILIAENIHGCKDTVSKELFIEYFKKGLFVPNAFSPEYGPDGTRTFKPAGIGLETYHIRIFNNWGELLWESYELTEDGQPAEGWDGIFEGILSPQDVYVWKIEATFQDGSIWIGKDYNGIPKKIGTATLIR